MKPETNSRSHKLSMLYLGLSAFFLGNAILAEFVGVKIFSVGNVFGFSGGGVISNINMSIGVIIWPLVFITSDLLNEYFGIKGVRRISFISAGIIVYASVVVFIGTKLPPAKFWLDANQNFGSNGSFNINLAYNVIFRQGISIIIGSVTAFLVSQLVDVYVFQYFRRISNHRYLWLRATGSTVISQLIDSFIILFIAFYLLGNWSLKQVFDVGLIQYIYKIALAILLTPVIYLAHYIIDGYLGRELAEETINYVDKEE